MSVITRILPKRRLSRLVGQWVHWQGPKWWVHLTIRNFARLYKINLEEAEKPAYEYPSLGEFFVRRLREGIRPVGESWAVHPADSRITQASPILNGTLIQAKGHNYRLADFTRDKKCEEKWGNGFFITYYLCPTDYHRVHCPVDGFITDVRYMPGDLWPVNEWSTSHVPHLFSVNERMLVEIETDLGSVGVVFVGATNVGSICLSFDGDFKGNVHDQQVSRHKHYNEKIPVKRGQELGMFRMGSTVVMLYPQHFREAFSETLNLGPVVKVNAALIK